MKPTELAEILLGTSGTDYLRMYLTEKGDMLSRLALNQDLEAGIAFAYLPSDIDAESPLNLNEGGIMRDPDLVDLAKGRVAKFVLEFLHASRNRIAMFETYFDARRIQDMNIQVPFFSYRGTRYGTWDGKEGGNHERGACLYATSESLIGLNVNHLVCGPGRPGTCFLSRTHSPTFKIDNGAEVPSAVLELLMLGILHIIVPAYDGESYLVWSGESSKPVNNTNKI